MTIGFKKNGKFRPIRNQKGSAIHSSDIHSDKIKVKKQEFDKYGVRGKPSAHLTKSEYNKLYPLLLGGLPDAKEKRFLEDLGKKYGYNWHKSKIGFLDNDGNLWIEKR